MPSLPTNFNNTDGLIDYGKGLGITVGLGFFFPALFLSLLLIIAFVKFCGGKAEKRDEFTSKARSILIVSAVLILGVAVATCAVGWSYNQRCHDGVKDGSETLQSVITSSSQVMLAVNSTVNDFKNRLLYEVNQTAAFAKNISNILIPLEGIFGVVTNAQSTLNNFSILVNTVANNITAVKADLANLQTLQGEGVISGVPSPNDVPNIDSSYTSALNSSTSDLKTVNNLARNLTDNVNATLTSVISTISTDLITKAIDYSQKADDALSYFMDFHSQISNTNDTFNRYSPDVVHYSSIRKSVVAAILVLPLALSIVSLVGIIFKLKLMLKLSAGFCFAFMFWYFLLAGVNYAGFYTLDQFCRNQDEIVGNAISISSSEINVPGSNVTVRVSDKVQLLLKCSGNTSLIEIFEFKFLIDEVNDTITPLLNTINNQVAELNQTDEYKKSVDTLLSVQQNSVDLDFLQNSSLPTVHSDLNLISTQLENTINNSTYNSSLQAVNNITNNLLLTNGTTIRIYYAASNITMLNCTVDPYSKLTSTTQQDLCTKATTAIALTITRNKAMDKASAIKGNITDINERLYGFESQLPTISYYQNQTSIWANQIRDLLDEAYSRAMAMIKGAQQLAKFIATILFEGVDNILTSTRCEYVGNAYSALSSNVCNDISPSLEVITAMMVTGACVFFFSTIISMLTVYKMDKDLGE